MQTNSLVPLAEAKPAIAAEINLIIAWGWVLLGFLSGTALGGRFHDEHWLGGFGSLKRRLYRLAHISFFGLGVVNFMFWLTQRSIAMNESFTAWASLGFAAGAVTMPLACVSMAHFPKSRSLFAVPVLSLVIAAGLTFLAVLKTTRGSP